nr:hypothetical protein [Rhizobium sp. 2MFCol3.1]
MGKRRLRPDNLPGPKLKDIRQPIIEVVCVRCDRRDSLDRKALVDQLGAGASFARLRRRLAMGCDRMTGPQGDRCETRFPCLDP